MPNARRGFTFIDLVIVLVIAALLAPVLLRSVQGSSESANRLKCAVNLRAIGQAMLQYAQSNRSDFPRTTYQPDAPPAQYTNSTAGDPFAAGGPQPNDVTAALFLLARTQNLPANSFVCPSTANAPWDFGQKNATACANFPGEEVLGYSLANPYPNQVAVKDGYKWSVLLGSDFPLVADMNPGSGDEYDAAAPQLNSPAQEIKKANSRNHQGDGQNVLYVDGHVEFQATAFCGVQRDNIYTVAGGAGGNPPTSATITGSPRWRGDCVMLPVATGDPSSPSSVPWLPIAGVVGALVMAAGAMAVVRGKKAAKEDAAEFE
jgi:prepilin-type processing-associated H-X9-DG protein